MKKRNLIITLMLTLALCATSIASVFAVAYKYPGYPDGTDKLEVVTHDVDSSQEATVEKAATQYAMETLAGGYTPVNADELKAFMEKGNVVVIDTMPAAAYATIHIKGAFCVEAPMASPTNFKDWNHDAPQYKKNPSDPGSYTAEFDKFMQTYATKKFYNSKTKKWVTKQPKASQFKGKKTKYVLKKAYKNTKFVTYCGFTGCGRSHIGAMYLAKMGIKNVYRFTGGISAWFDLGYPMEGEYIK